MNPITSLLASIVILSATLHADPIEGKWRFFNNAIRVFNPDGTSTNEAGQRDATWKCTESAPGVPRKYVITYGKQFMDTLTLTKGDSFLDGHNNFQTHVTAGRIGDAAKPAQVPPLQIKKAPAPAAAGAAADPDDKEIALHPKWMPDRRSVTDQSMKATAFYARAAIDGVEPGKEIVPAKVLLGAGWDLDWLMPLREAEKRLPPGTQMQMAGADLLRNGTWPQNSIYVRSAQGKFSVPGYQQEIPSPAVFTEIYLICDRKQRLIGVQFKGDDRQSPGWDPLMMKNVLKVEKLNPFYDLMAMGANAVAGRHVEYQIVRHRDKPDVVVPGMTCIHTLLPAMRSEIGSFKRNVRWYLATPYARKLVEIAEMYESGNTQAR